ncbi:MAG: acyl-CoA dehydrogenase family protein, partial [Acidimicrobiales bacterium]|nr:acyl-CoA dehydrogenase family protein [Acidimicrobiales bacterium]
MDFDLSPSEQAFQDEVRTWLEEHLVGEFADLRGRGGTGQEDIPAELLIAWEQELASGGWLGLGYPAEYGGRPATLGEQVVFHMTYVESRAPGRMPNLGVTLLGPTVVAYGTEEQKKRFVPPILRSEELWCQGYSEPNAGSDLANVATKARLDGEEWVINGQKVWTSLAQYAQWCFVVARTDPESDRHRGLSYLLVEMDQPGIEIRPIVQITGGTEFNEVFFTDARTSVENVVGGVGRGWEVAMGTLGFERGASTLGQQLSFRRELDDLLALAKANGTADDPVVRQKLAHAYSTLEIMRYNNLRMLTVVDSGGVPGPEMSIGKLYWANWHRDLGELMMLVRGTSAL